MTCPHCGAPNPENSRFCSTCGQAIPPGPPPPRPYTQHESKLWIWIAIGAVPVFIVTVMIVAAIAIPNLLRARMAANEASALDDLRIVLAAEDQYAIEKQRYASLTELRSAGYLPADTTPKHGYRLRELTADTGFRFVMEPVTPGSSGTRIFCATHDGPLRSANALKATVQSCFEAGDVLQ